MKTVTVPIREDLLKRIEAGEEIEFCSACQGTGAHLGINFFLGVMWCPACRGSGTKEAQDKEARKEEEVNEQLRAMGLRV